MSSTALAGLLFGLLAFVVGLTLGSTWAARRAYTLGQKMAVRDLQLEAQQQWLRSQKETQHDAVH